MINMTKNRLALGAIALAILSSQATAQVDMKKIQKDAFSMGIQKALLVIDYEKKQAEKKIEENYCISLKNKNGGDPRAYDAIKMESLSLYLGYSPSFLSILQRDNSEKAILCFDASSSTFNQAEQKLSKIRGEYDKIDSYMPSIILLSPAFKRIIPAVGEIFPDRSIEIDGLRKALKEKEEKINTLTSQIDKVISKISDKSKLVPAKKPSHKKGSFSIIENTQEIKKKAFEVDVFKGRGTVVKAEKKNKRVMFIEKDKKLATKDKKKQTLVSPVVQSENQKKIKQAIVEASKSTHSKKVLEKAETKKTKIKKHHVVKNNTKKTVEKQKENSKGKNKTHSLSAPIKNKKIIKARKTKDKAKKTVSTNTQAPIRRVSSVEVKSKEPVVTKTKQAELIKSTKKHTEQTKKPTLFGFFFGSKDSSKK